MGVVEKELGVLASDRKRVEWLGRSLAVPKCDAVKLRQKQNGKQGRLDQERTSTSGPASVIKKEVGSSGYKRHRCAISPLRESGKKMLRSDSGKKAYPIDPNADNQMHPYPANLRDAGFGNMTKPDFLSLGGRNLSDQNIGNQMRKSRGLPKLQDDSISRRPSHKLVREFKTCVKEAGSRKSFATPSFEKKHINFTIMEGGDSDWPTGDQTVIKRKSLRPPGSIFKIATPVTWFPSYSTSNKWSKMDLLSSASIFDTSGTGKAGRSTLKQKNLKTSVRKEGKKENKTVSEGVSRMERGSLHDTERPERHTQKTSDFNSNFCKWVLTPSSVNLNSDKDRVLKPELASEKSGATKPSVMASHRKTVDTTSERESWSERMKAFLLSCGALLPETNTSKHSKQSYFTSRLEVGADDHHEWKDLPGNNTVHSMEKKEGLVSLRLPKMVNDKERVKKPDMRRGGLEVAKTNLKLVSGVEISHSNENSWESPRKFNRQRNIDNFEGGKKSPVKRTKLGKSFIGRRKGHDLLLNMLNTVSTGISKQKILLKQESLQESGERRIKIPVGLGKYASTLVSLKVKDRSNTFRCKEGSKRGQKKLRLVEVKDPEDAALLRISEGEKNVVCTFFKSEGAKNQDNTLQVCKNMEDCHVRRDLDSGMQFLNKGMRDSTENWLNVSGGFEFLDRADEDNQNFKRPDLSETFREDSDFQSSSDRTSLHSWSVRSAEIGVPKAFGSVSVENESFRKEQEKVSHGESMGMDKGRNVSSSSCKDNLQSQGLPDFSSDPVDSFIEEYKEKSEVRGVMMHEVIEGGKQSVDDSPVAENLIPFDFKSQKRASSGDMVTRWPPNVEAKLTETEELELALLELVMKCVLRNDMVENTKRGCTTQGTSSLVPNQREPQTFQVDQGLQARAHDILHEGKPLSPTPKSSESARSSVRHWPEYISLAEKQSRSESCEEDEDWPEYLGLDEQAGNIERDGERDLPVAEDYSGQRSEPETFHDPLTMTDPLHDASKTTPSSPLATNFSESNDRKFIQFPGLPILAFSCATSPRAKEASYVAERSSTGVQTSDLSVGQDHNSVYVLPLCCLPDGRPFLTPYSMYPHYPVSISQIHPIQIPPAVESVQSHATTAVIADDVRGTSDIHRHRTEELKKLNSENESRLELEGKSLSSSSSDAPLSSPSTPSTPSSSPEHEARVASALAHHRRRQKRQVLPCSPDVIDGPSNRKGENEDTRAEHNPYYQQLPVSIQEPLALARYSYAEKGHEEYPVALTTENQMSHELGRRSICDASASTRKEFVYYDDSESSELADSYDGSGSSEVSVCHTKHSGEDAPFVGLRVEGLEKLNRAPTTPVSVTEARVQSPGETKHSIQASFRQADGLGANVGRYSLEGHLMHGERDITRWSGVAPEPGVPFSEGEIDPGELESEGECGRIYSKSEFQYQKHQHGGDVSEPGEVSRTDGQKGVTTGFDSMQKSSFIQSLSEGEIRPAELGQINTARGYAEQSSSDLGGI